MAAIELNELKAIPVLSIRTTTKMELLHQTIGESYTKIMDYMGELGEQPAEQPAEAPYTAYYNLDMQNLDVEMGFPVSKLYDGKGDINAHELPTGKYVSYLYKGPYSGMEVPYNEMFKWIAENGYESTGVYYEYYYNKPGTGPGEVPESELLTKIAMPVK